MKRPEDEKTRSRKDEERKIKQKEKYAKSSGNMRA